MSDRNFSIAVIRGDGIGVEVVEEGLKVLRTVDDRAALGLEFTEFPWGSDYYFEQGSMMGTDPRAQTHGPGAKLWRGGRGSQLAGILFFSHLDITV